LQFHLGGEVIEPVDFIESPRSQCAATRHHAE
jgi:hypothetical protein